MPHTFEKEFVKDYPRPPQIVFSTELVKVVALGKVIIQTNYSARILETYHPPTYYFPPDCVLKQYLNKDNGRPSFCEWKGIASYFNIEVGNKVIKKAIWTYQKPSAYFEKIAGWYAVYPHLMDGCWVNNEKVESQKGGFYGGWITSRIKGPFKGDPEHPELI